MKKNSFVTSKFKSYIATCKRKGETIILETVGKEEGEPSDMIYFANGYTAFKCPLWLYKEDLQEIFSTDAPEVGKVKVVSGTRNSGAKETIEKIIGEAKTRIAKTDIILTKFGKDRLDVHLFATEQNGSVVDKKFLDMYSIEGAEYYATNESQSAPIVAKYTSGIEVVFLPVFPGANYRDKVKSYATFWSELYGDF